jgi:hypothetical protein
LNPNDPSAPTPSVSNTMWGSGTTLTLCLGKAVVFDTWVKVTVLSGGVSDLQGHALDGEAAAVLAGGTGHLSNGVPYLYSSADMPTGNGMPGGNAVFYVGSLRGDFGVGRTPIPDGHLSAGDVSLFVKAYQAGSLTADFGVGRTPMPDGQLSAGDVSLFVKAYQAGMAAGLHLGALPPVPSGGGGSLMALASDTSSGGSSLSVTTSSGTTSGGLAPVGSTSASDGGLAATGTSDALDVAAPVGYVAPATDTSLAVVTTASAPVAQVSGAATSGSTTDASLSADGGLVDALATASAL